MSSLWNKLPLNESAELQTFKPYIYKREKRLVQFFYGPSR